MTPLFADTYFYLSTINPNDRAHEASLSWAASNPRILTSEWVILELADGLCDSRSRELATRLIRSVRGDPRTRVVPLSSALLREAMALYESRPDKGWSLTDCTSFTIMKRKGLSDALTADKHFVQAGFTALLM